MVNLHFCAGKRPPAFRFVLYSVIIMLLSPALAPAWVNKDAAASARPQKSQPSSTDSTRAAQKIVREGIAVQFEIEPLAAQKKQSSLIEEGNDARVRFSLNFAGAGTPLSGTRPAVWIDARRDGERADCSKKISTFLSASLTYRPTIDLNSYYVLALNHDSTITVVDPLFHFGGTKLLAMVSLKSPGEDWALTSDQAKLFVSLPDSNQIAVVDTTGWKITSGIDVPTRPTRVRLQPDEQYLWVTYGGAASGPDSGVAVISAADFRLVARIQTGRGQHELAFSDDSRFAYVTNKDENTVSVIETRGLKKTGDIAVGQKPVSIAFSNKAGFAYVASEDGQITALDGARLKSVARMQATAGLGQIKFAPDSRLGFVVNPEKNLVHIFDASSNQIIQAAGVQSKPDQLAFTSTMAYVRSRTSELVYMIPLDQIGAPGSSVPVIDFPGGQAPLGKTSRPSSADTIVKAPDADAVLVANPTDMTIYYYKQGMAAPMGNFSNYRREPRAVLVIDRSLKEAAPGVYETTLKLPRAGVYDVAFVLDAPRVVHCFEVTIAPDPKLEEAKKNRAVRIEPLIANRRVRVGETIRLQFRLSDLSTKEPRSAKDVYTLIFLSPGIWQDRQLAKEVSAGVYEIGFKPPQPGVYYLFAGSPSLGLVLNNNRIAVLEAAEAAASK